MSKVTSLTAIPDAQLNRWIRRIGLLFLLALIAFVAFYVVDRSRPARPEIVDQQLVALEEAVRADPADTASRGQLADLYFAKHRFEDAIVQYTALIDSDSNVERASLGRGDSYRELGRYDEAIKDYERVVVIGSAGEMAVVDASLQAALHGLGSIAVTQGRPADAIEPLTKALVIMRTDADSLNLLGVAYLDLDQPELALESLQMAVAVVPTTWAEPYVNLGRAYAALGQPEMAAWANAMGQAQSGDPGGAEQELLKLVDGPAGLDAAISLGLIAETEGDTATAADWYRKALAIDPANVSAGMGLKRVSTIPGQSAAPSAPAAGSN